MAEIKATPATGALGLFNQRTIHGFVPSADSYAPAVRVQEVGQQLFRSLGLTDPSDNDIWDAMVVGLINQQLANDPGVTRGRRYWTARWISGPTVSAFPRPPAAEPADNPTTEPASSDPGHKEHLMNTATTTWPGPDVISFGLPNRLCLRSPK